MFSTVRFGFAIPVAQTPSSVSAKEPPVSFRPDQFVRFAGESADSRIDTISFDTALSTFSFQGPGFKELTKALDEDDLSARAAAAYFLLDAYIQGKSIGQYKLQEVIKCQKDERPATKWGADYVLPMLLDSYPDDTSSEPSRSTDIDLPVRALYVLFRQDLTTLFEAVRNEPEHHYRLLKSLMLLKRYPGFSDIPELAASKPPVELSRRLVHSGNGSIRMEALPVLISQLPQLNATRRGALIAELRPIVISVARYLHRAGASDFTRRQGNALKDSIASLTTQRERDALLAGMNAGLRESWVFAGPPA